MLATIQLAQTLPEGGMIPLFVALAAGVALWLAGVKIVRIVFLILGAALGGFVGSVLMPLTGLPSLNLGALTLTPGFTGLIAGAVIGALVAMAMLRLVVILTAAGAMAVVGAMAAFVFIHFSPATDTSPGDPAAYTENTEDLRAITDDLARRTRDQTQEALDLLNRNLTEDAPTTNIIEDLNTEENRERLRDAAERSKAFLQGVSARIQADYEARPARDKLVILSSTLAGLAVGLLMGVAMPKRSSALVTSLMGSALWLAAAVALVRANTDPDPAYLNQPPLTWAIVWTIAAILGMVVQFGLIKRKGSKPANEQSDD